MAVLADDMVTGQETRVLLGTLVEQVIPHKDGADVVFAPIAIMGGAAGEAAVVILFKRPALALK